MEGKGEGKREGEGESKEEGGRRERGREREGREREGELVSHHVNTQSSTPLSHTHSKL